MLSLISKTQPLQHLIDSDDELPFDYKESPDIPAYLNENRFEQITFPWLKNYDINNTKKYSKKSHSHPCETNTYAKQIKPKKTLIKKGILDQEDVYCLKSVAALTNDTMLLWFVDFLMYKDLQTDYKFLKSCLVSDITNIDDTNIFLLTNYYKQFKYEIVTKN